MLGTQRVLWGQVPIDMSIVYCAFMVLDLVIP